MAGSKLRHVLEVRGRLLRRRHVMKGRELVIGGDPRACDAALQHAGLPPRAAKLEKKQDGIYFVSLSPDSQFLVNDRPVLQVKLKEGDVLTLGAVKARYRLASPSRGILVSLLILLVAVLAGLYAAYITSDRHYRNLALKEYEKGNAEYFLNYVEQEYLANPEKVEADEKIMEVAEKEYPEVTDAVAVVEDELTTELRQVLSEFKIKDPQVSDYAVEKVERWVKKFTTNRFMKRHAQKALERSVHVDDIILPRLRKAGLPENLIFLAFAESNFRTDVESHAHALGLWQFMKGTAGDYGLADRTDPVASTEAAARYMTDLVSIFGTDSILLAMASYNAGDGNIRKCLKRSVNDPYSERSFWHLKQSGCLPEETSDYVPKILALALIGRNPEKYGFTKPVNYTLDKLNKNGESATISDAESKAPDQHAHGG